MNKLLTSFQKYELEVHGHQPIIEKVVTNGEQLTRSRHFASEDIKDKCEELKEAWAELLEHSQHRKTKLDFSLQKQAVSPCDMGFSFRSRGVPLAFTYHFLYFQQKDVS